jgi:uncharacterized damage-inducible protein DinB
MDELLLEAFRHNIWASKRLIEFCRDLSSEQLRSTAPATFGTIFDTLNHMVLADANYLPRPKMDRPAWALEERDAKDLDELEARVDETAPLWEVYLADPLEARHPLLLDQGAFEVQSSVPIVQALHHGNSHREQVCAIITSLGLEPPDLQAWAFALETGRARELRPAT